jgi:flagellar biosynthesis protein FlhA
MSFALLPALPKIPFLLIGGAFFAVGWARKDLPTKAQREAAEAAAALPAAAPATSELGAGRDAALDALALDPLELAIGFGLVPMVDQGAGGTLLARVGTIRRQIASELGMVIPSVRIRDDIALDSHEYVMRVRGTEVARGGLMPGHHLAMDPGDAMGQLPGIPTTEPAFGLPAVWIADSGRAEAEALGWTVVDGESVVVTHLTETIRAHAADLLTRQETRQLLDQLKEINAAVVEEVVPDVLSVGEIQRVLQALLREAVSVRDLGAIVEAIGDKARLTRDPAMLAEYARQALGRTIVGPALDADGTLKAIALDPTLEQEIAEALVQTADGEFLALDPSRAGALVDACAEQVDAALSRGGRPVLLCSARVRRHLRRLTEQRLPQLSVCSYNEIVPGIGVDTLAVLDGASLDARGNDLALSLG